MRVRARTRAHSLRPCAFVTAILKIDASLPGGGRGTAGGTKETGTGKDRRQNARTQPQQPTANDALSPRPPGNCPQRSKTAAASVGILFVPRAASHCWNPDRTEAALLWARVHGGGVGVRHTPSIAFRHLPPNSARFSYATEGALFYLRPAVQRRGQRPPKGSGTNMTVEAT